MRALDTGRANSLQSIFYLQVPKTRRCNLSPSRSQAKTEQEEEGGRGRERERIWMPWENTTLEDAECRGKMQEGNDLKKKPLFRLESFQTGSGRASCLSPALVIFTHC